ncbi:MAG: hypothetical protein ABFC98_01135 [Candidatus Cloacimonas sp.]
MKKDIHTLPEDKKTKRTKPLFSVLRSQEGYSLAELLIVAIVIAVMVLTIYIGIEFAEKQITRDYRQRIATFILTGELEKQYTLYMKEGTFHTFKDVPVIIDQTKEMTITGRMYVTAQKEEEYYLNNTYGFYYVIGEVRWVDPVTEKEHYVRMREDFYN